MTYYYKQPAYYTKFHCLGSSCSFTCCRGWRIDWRDYEVEHLNNANLPENIKSKIDDSFQQNPENEHMYYIKACKDGRCPFHNIDNDLCEIQLNAGEKFLGVTCGEYPRAFRKRDNIIFRACSMSCPAVINLLVGDENACKLENVIAHDYDSLRPFLVKYDTEDNVRLSPYLFHRVSILDFYKDLFLSSDDIDITLVLGALAAKKISDASDEKDTNRIQTVLNEYRKQFNNTNILTSINEINPNYRLKYLIINNMCTTIFNDSYAVRDIAVLHNKEAFVNEKYLIGKKNFEEAFENSRFILRNLTMNLFYELYIDKYTDGVSFFDIYMLFAAYSTFIQVLAYSIGYSSGHIKDEFVISMADLTRCLTHGESRTGKVIDYMKNLGITSPAHIALIVK